MLLLMMARDTPEDKSKFEKIYSKYKDVMYYAAYGILGGQYEAEDAVSQLHVIVIADCGLIGATVYNLINVKR